MKKTAALLFLALFAGTAHAAPAQDFYKGKQITMMVASGVGGGYDTYARAFARYLPKYIPGNPTIVPKNEPGAGGLIAISTLYNTSPKDGLTMAALTNGVAMDPLFGTAQGRYDALKLNWLGSLGKLDNICITLSTSPIKTVQQMQKQEVIVSASGAGGNSAIMPKILNAFIGTKFKVVGGYTEGSGVTLAMENGEVGGVCGMSYSTLKATHPDWFRDKKVNVVLQIGLHKIAALPDVPNALDLVQKPDDKKVLELILIRQEMGRPFALPPGVPADRVAILRKAFNETLKDPGFIAEAAKLQLDLAPLTGADIDGLLKMAYNSPKPIVARAAAFSR